MPAFVWKGKTREGKAVAGERVAENKEAVMALLRREQILVSSVKEKGKEVAVPRFGGSVPPKQLAIFVRQFSVMIDAGLPLVQCLEILVPNAAIRNLIREDKIHQIYSSMQTGQEKYGMQTFNQSLATLYFTKQISLQTALGMSSMPDELQDMINRVAGLSTPQAGGRPPQRPASRSRR